MITSLYPFVLETVTNNKLHPNMSTTLYPVVIEQLAHQNNQVSLSASVNFIQYPQPYFAPPSINSLELINDGKEGFAAMYANMYLIAYSSKVAPSDIIGNISVNGVHWSPPENNTDPPSHFVLVNKDLSYDCTFYPVFDAFSGMFAMAWIENNAVGRLNLKYTNINVPGSNTLNNNNNNGSGNNDNAPVINAINQTIYVRPNLATAKENEATENIPFNDVAIADVNGNVFHLNAYHQHRKQFGYEMVLPQQIQSVTFSQKFRERKTLECLIGTAPKAATVTTDFVPSIPLQGIQVNVYHSEGKILLNSYYTDVNGKFRVPVGIGVYTFEIIVDTPSINFSQIYV